MESGFCRLVKINSMYSKTQLSLQTRAVSIDADTAEISVYQKCTQTNRQTAFKLYICSRCHTHGMSKKGWE